MGGHRSPANGADSSAMHPFRFGLQCRGPADARGWPALARQVEDLGWSTLTVADHLDDALAPIPALMAAADATTTLRVGTMVLANDYRHPVVLAKEAATLDVLTDGRFDLGHRRRVDGHRLRRPQASPSIGQACGSIAWRRRWPSSPGSGGTARARSPVATTACEGMSGHPRPVTPGGPPIVIGGGGERVLRLAGQHADVVGLNVNLRAGVIDERAFPDGTPTRTDQKVAWVREAAAGRRQQPELQVRVHLAAVTAESTEAERMIEELAPGFGLTPDEARETPHALIGSVEALCDQLVERRERWGISYLGLSQDQMTAFSPVVARLAGT